MEGERDLWACASEMIRRHGREARAHAIARVSELATAGDDEGVLIWKLIAHRVAQLQKDPGGRRH